MKKVAFFFGVGLLPLWASILIVFLGGLLPPRSSEYWAAAPWLIIASIPVSGATLLIAVATLARQALASGDCAQKYKAAASFFWSLTLLAGAVAGVFWLRHELRQNEIEDEKRQAAEFVRDHSLVIQKAGRGPLPFLSSFSANSGQLPMRYEFANPAGYVIVSIVQSSGKREFHLDCITSLSLGGRDPTQDPCKQGLVSTEIDQSKMHAGPSINMNAAR